jgi:lincosamide nucleotidyltransferase A/C/D/E
MDEAAVVGMSLTEVMSVLRALNRAGIRYWLEGGWGVDELVGHQTRSHRDLEVDVDSTQEAQTLDVLAQLGYALETDWRPNRAELIATGRGWVDLHPLLLDPDGTVRQAALGGGFHLFPTSCFTVGRLDGLQVPCVSAAAQLAFHQGYRLRPVDRYDVDLLKRLPEPQQ